MTEENHMTINAADHYERGECWWIPERMRRAMRDLDHEPERDDVLAGHKTQAMVED